MKCQKCNNEMVRVGEHTILLHFDVSERSIFVWKCPLCGYTKEEMI